MNNALEQQNEHGKQPEREHTEEANDLRTFRRGQMYYYDRQLYPEELQEISECNWTKWRRHLIDLLVNENGNSPTHANELSRVIQTARRNTSVRFQSGPYANGINTLLRNWGKPYGITRASMEESDQHYRFYRRKS